MPDIHRDIPSLAILLPLFVAAAAGVFLHLRGKRAATAPRLFLGLVACVYGAAVLSEVLLPFTVILGPARSDLAPWSVFIQPVPLASVLADPSNLLDNIALFAPLGVLVPLVTPVRSLRGVVLVGASVSLGIEVLQFVLDITITTGHVADVDDVIGNVIGTLVGAVVYRLILLIPSAPRIAAALAFPSPIGLRARSNS